MIQMEKKILSFDVGIKNLAYCLITKNGDDFKIDKWGIINLASDQQKCSFLLRGGKCCESSAKYTIGASLFSCESHKEKILLSIREPIGETIDGAIGGTIKNIPKCENEKCKKKSVFKCSDNYYCNTHAPKCKKNILTNCAKHPIQNLSNNLFEILDSEKMFLTVSEVLIENQPSLKNPTMKTIATLIFSYFVMRGIIDKNTTKSNITDVRFISPSNKLKVNKENTNNELVKNEKEKYICTKKLGVKYCSLLINDADKEILNKYKKKDDMCDAFLQGFQYIFSPIPNKYVLLLVAQNNESVIKKAPEIESEMDTKKASETISKKAPETISKKAPETISKKAPKTISKKAPKIESEMDTKKVPETISKKVPEMDTKKVPKKVPKIESEMETKKGT